MAYSIAIDGPAGAGKSTIAKAVAAQKGFVHIDTGAMYRAMGLRLTEKGIDVRNEADASAGCEEVDITITFEDGVQQVYADGKNVTGLIRTEEAGFAASTVSVHPAVRRKLVELQQKLAETTDVVMDGRDIGTVVLPNAQLKIFLTADAGERAKRRVHELEKKGIQADLQQITEEIAARDYQDMNRPVSPLKQADDAILLDTSHMTIEEVVDAILNMIP